MYSLERRRGLRIREDSSWRAGLTTWAFVCDFGGSTLSIRIETHGAGIRVRHAIGPTDGFGVGHSMAVFLGIAERFARVLH
jgi:hypothetical protein